MCNKEWAYFHGKWCDFTENCTHVCPSIIVTPSNAWEQWIWSHIGDRHFGLCWYWVKTGHSIYAKILPIEAHQSCPSAASACLRLGFHKANHNKFSILYFFPPLSLCSIKFKIEETRPGKMAEKGKIKILPSSSSSSWHHSLLLICQEQRGKRSFVSCFYLTHDNGPVVPIIDGIS